MTNSKDAVISERLSLILQRYKRENNYDPDVWEQGFYAERVEAATDNNTWLEDDSGIVAMFDNEIFFFDQNTDDVLLLLDTAVAQNAQTFLRPLGHSLMDLHPLLQKGAIKGFHGAQNSLILFDPYAIKKLRDTAKWVTY